MCVPGYMHECTQNLSTATPPTIPQRHQCDHSWPQASGITKTAVALGFFSLVSHWLVTVCHQWNVCIHMAPSATDSVLSIRGWMLRTECLSTYPCSYFSCVVLFILSFILSFIKSFLDSTHNWQTNKVLYLKTHSFLRMGGAPNINILIN